MSTNSQINDELVTQQLLAILNYGEIKHSPVLSRFLSFVVDKKLFGREDEIKEYTIGVTGLGKPTDFNPQLDASVRIHAGRLRKVLQQYYSGQGKNDTVLIDIPKGGYIPVFENRNAINGNSIPTPDPLNQTIENIPLPSLNGHSKPIIAVLPFHNLSSDNSKDYFVTGIGEQLSTDLARFQNISVISYYSTYNYDSALIDLQEMKKTVNIDYVLTGSVRFINELARLNVQLILPENGHIIFTETYSRHLTPENIFDIQEEITGEILNIIADDNGIIVMSKAHASPFTKTKNLTVQEAIYKYFDYTADYNYEKFDSTVESLEHAVAAEPQNGLAGALLASLYMFSYSTKKETDGCLLQKGFDLAQAAIRSDPQCQHAQKALAWGLLLYNQKEKSCEIIERCIKLNPKACTITSLMALAYIALGEYVDGFKWLLQSIHLNPVAHTSAKLGFCLYYFHKGDYEESFKWMERLNTVGNPLFILIRLSLLGKINKKKIEITDNILDLQDDALSIINRMIMEPALRLDIVDGCKIAGLKVREN
jgi:TolB-like protein